MVGNRNYKEHEETRYTITGGDFIVYLTKRQLYKKVEDCRNILRNSGLCEPFSIDMICNRFSNIAVSYIPLKTKGLRGIVALSTEDEPKNCILINSNLPEEEKHFHSIHEFMHIVLHSSIDSKTFNCYDKVMSNQNSSIEWQANEGAAQLIIPYSGFIPLFSRLFYEYSSYSDYWKFMYGHADIFQVLAQQYNVSVPVIKNRVSTLSYEIDQFRAGVEIDKIELLSHNKQLSLGIKVTDYLTDIQALSATKYYFSQALDWDAVLL